MNNLLQGYSSEEESEEAAPSILNTEFQSSPGLLAEKTSEEKNTVDERPLQASNNEKRNKAKKKSSCLKKNKYLKEFYDISSCENIKVFSAEDALGKHDDKDKGVINVIKTTSKDNWRPSINQKRKHQVS